MHSVNPGKEGGRTPCSKDEAQQRADQIEAFSREVAQLEQDGILLLAPEQEERVGLYHAEMLTRLSRKFDIDVGQTAKQMSLGMRIVSFLGALALSAALFFFFYRFWGLLPTSAQVAILTVAPLALLAG